MRFDLVLANGRVIDPSQGIDAVCDVAFSNTTVAAIGEGLAASGHDVRDVSGRIVTPGLIDLHTHVYWGGTSLGIDAEAFARDSAVTTCVDTGSAGPGNFAGFRSHVIDKSDVRILAYLHVSFAGIYAFSHRVMVGESHDFRLMAPREAVNVIEKNRDVIIGIKVRIGKQASGAQGIAPLDAALGVSDQTGLPVMCHIDEPPPSYEAVVSKLRRGDVLTHCFRPFPNSPVMGDGTIKKEVIAARERGVYFDIGHGMGSFSYKTARSMLERDFPPDTISSDVHAFCIDGPAYDQLTTLTKFLGLGMPLNEVIERTTVRAAKVLGRPELGTFAPGSVGDASVLSLQSGRFQLEDVEGETLEVDERLVADGVVIGGQWWHPT